MNHPVYATRNVISHVKRSVPLHQHFPQSVCSAQYGYFLLCLDLVLSTFSYLLYHSQSVPVSPVITDITIVFTFHMHCFITIRSLYLSIYQLLSWSHFCLLTLQHLFPFLITHYDVRFNVRVGSISLQLSRPQCSYLHCLLLLLPSVLHKVTLQFVVWLYSHFPWHMLQCGSAHTLSSLFMYYSFANTGHADMLRSIVS